MHGEIINAGLPFDGVVEFVSAPGCHGAARVARSQPCKDDSPRGVCLVETADTRCGCGVCDVVSELRAHAARKVKSGQ